MAGHIPPQFIDELLARVDIVDVIDARVPLKKAGKNLHACCPFHNEKTPSFTVSPDKQFYHCFGCGAHGTAVGFLMEYDHLSFPEAVQELADMVGMQVPASQQVKQNPATQSLYDLMEKVSQYYKHQLLNHPQRQVFVDYLKQRGLSSQTIDQFDIGMAPDGWDNVLRTFGGNQQMQQQLLQGGLLIDNEKGRVYDRFRKRLMFPIRDHRGRVIGFGGRVIDPEDTPKYLNSPETPIFHKGTELYGLFRARKSNRRLQRVVIVEGYMDVVALAQHGVNNAVATLGTATTADHLRKLLRAAPEVVFCFDGDRAGRDAAWRAAENALPLLGGNHELKFCFLPDGEDPDSLVNSQGADAFNQLIENAQSFSDFFFNQLLAQVDANSIDGRARMIELAKPHLKQIPGGVYRDMIEQRLAELAKTTVATLNKHIDPASQPPSGRKTVSASKKTTSYSPVRMAVTILLQYPKLAEQAKDLSSLKNLDIAGVNVLIALLETLHEHPHLTTAALMERWRDTEHAAHLRRLAVEPLALSEDALQHELKGILERLSKQAAAERLKYLTSKPFSELTDAEKQEVRSFK
ncbi:DNA primase [Methylophaga lonarensis MPL]|uniref:DNA primase n=1 Tax=Methylophaga lonarensis MPL TaxID=1286106 RepID=M7NYT7_9GAMM|nr:DNA primase [Methylophaga lonarensis]EMR14003.1 DNA primase [Methylophaga lonarensis MPL]